MIKRIADLNYYELLEVSSTATAQEIHKAYERIRRVYEPNSVALYSLFTPEETAEMYQRIEDAYRTLVYEDNRRRYDITLRNRDALPDLPASQPAPPAPKYQPQPIQPALSLPSDNRYISAQEEPQQSAALASPQEPASPISQFIAEFTGPVIKAVREQRGLTLRNIADMTKLGMRYLEFIEEENFKKLPARPYIRGFLILYAKALGCEPERMAGDYLKRYDAAMTSGK